MTEQAGPLLRRHLGDRRFLLTLPRAVGLQVLHPVIATALREHAPNRLWEHKKRTVSQMIYLAHTGRAADSVIRFAHEHVKGVDDHGHRYHALHPDVFLFQHATYVETLMTAADLFGPALAVDDRDQLYRETRAWYRTYGVSDRLLPLTRPEFTEYFTDACATQLRISPAAHEFRDQVLRPDAWIVRHLPAGAARAMQHPRARTLFGIRPAPADTTALRAVALTARTGFTIAPRRIRYVSQARARTVR
ncbi:oxygenase MpaB family protein [Nocardia sp. NPDC055029]